MSKQLLILGGGIKGAALAALAALGHFQVTLTDRDLVGAGTTSTNLGRLHLGTVGWRKDSPQLISRRRSASELVRRLPLGTHSQRDALYCFEDAEDAHEFQRVVTSCGISYVLEDGANVDHRWSAPELCAVAVRVPEFSFNPARLAGRFAQTCVNHGGTVRTNQRATRLARMGDKLVATFADGTTIAADVVINTMSRWCNELELPAGAPRLDVGWSQWRMLCMPTRVLPIADRLDQVVVVMDRGRKTPSAIPHADWITLDYNETRVHPLQSPEGNDALDWRPFSASDVSDADTLAAVARVFRPVQDALDRGAQQHLFSLGGIHARLSSARPGSTSQLITSQALPNYFVTFGGQASTGLLDALEIMDSLADRGLCGRTEREALFGDMIASLSPMPYPAFRPMRWEQHAFDA